MENFVLYDEIGSGSKRTVYKGRRKGSVSYVAIHCVEKAHRNLIQNHVRISYELDHSNVVKFYEWYETSNHLWLVVELCAGDSLQNILSQDSFLPERVVKCFGKDLVTGLAYLHSQDIIYADLCPSNILLDADGTLKYSNFCISKFVDSEVSEVLTTQGSPHYISPEVLKGEEQSKQCDLWALGCVLYELFTGTQPFKAVSYETLCEQILEANTPYPMQGHDGTFVKASENLYMLIQGLLQKDPLQRIDWLELCLHPFWDGELSHLADSFDVRGSQSIASSICTSAPPTNRDNLDESRSAANTTSDDLALMDSLVEPEEEISRPETVPKINQNAKLQTQSLNLRDEKEIKVTSSVKSVSAADNKQGWKGTFKLERGLAVYDLTGLDNNGVDSHRSEINDESVEHQNLLYPESRKTKATPTTSRRTSMDYSLDASMNSASSLGFSEIIPHLGGPDLNVLDHLYHPSDLLVSPIAENKSLVKLPSLKWDGNVLGFSAIPNDKLQNSSKEDIRNYLKTIVQVYLSASRKPSTADKTGMRQKMHIAAYLVSAARTEEIANNILDDRFIKCFLNDLKSTSHQDLKMRVARLLSVIASNATAIDPLFSMSEVFSVTTDQLKQNFRSTQFRQTLLPVIGEFLFYAATQEENEARLIQAWEPVGAVFTMITRCLHHDDGEFVTRLIAAKIIENVTSTTGRYCKKFVSNDVGLGLWHLYLHSATDTEKVTASSALCRLGMHSSSVIQHVSDRAGFDHFREGTYTATHRSQQAFITMFVTLLSSAIHSKRILQDSKLLVKFIHNLDSPSLILKGKIYLLLAEMCVRSHAVLLSCCENRMIMHIERDSRRVMSGKDNKELLEYVHQCLTVVVNNVVKTLPTIIEGIIHILEAVSGRHHPNPAQTKQLKTHLPLFSIFLYMITSSMFRKRISDGNFLAFTGKLLKKIRKIHSREINLSGQATRDLGDSLTTTMFSIIEAITQHPNLLVDNQDVFIHDVLPILATFIKSEDGNLRILCLKLFSEICTFFLESEGDELTTPRNNQKSPKAALLKVVESHFIPEFENLLQDQVPLPAYSLKLMYACTEKSHDFVKLLLNKKIIVTLLSILQNHQSEVNSSVLQSTIGVLNNIVAEKELDFIFICQQGLMDNLTSVFLEVTSALDDEANMNIASHLLLQLLDTLHHVLKNIEAAVKRILSSSKQSEIATHIQTKSTTKQEVEELLQQGKVLAELNGILLNLLVYDDRDIQEWSCRCLYLSAELFGGSHQECFTVENLQCMCTAIKMVARKRQKLLLRIVKRFAASSNKFKQNIRESASFKELFKGLSVLHDEDNDSKSVRNVSLELLKLFK